MARRRRSPEDARAEILAAAERCFHREGPSGVTLKAVAAEVGISHPGVLHHFRSANLLNQALHQSVSQRIRQELLEALAGDRSAGMMHAMAELADPKKGRLLAWVVAEGHDPFPVESEAGLAQVAKGIAGAEGSLEEVKKKLLLVVLAMVGESVVGEGVRARVGLADQGPDVFRKWLLELVSRPSGPKSGPQRVE